MSAKKDYNDTYRIDRKTRVKKRVKKRNFFTGENEIVIIFPPETSVSFDSEGVHEWIKDENTGEGYEKLYDFNGHFYLMKQLQT